MKIILEKTGKKFYREWIFRNLDLELSSGNSLAVLGPNGSGKSTLLQVISGYVIPTEGSIQYFNGTEQTSAEDVFEYVSVAAPYLELIEEFTLKEIIRFHFRFKAPANNLTENEIISLTGLEHAKDKVFRYFSSGMKQRTRLSLALLSNVKIVLLDEPCSNLDREGIKWYRELARQFSNDRIMVVGSNSQTEEFDFCQRQINLMDWKVN
ncbi:MAG: ATP-binding cassette domain-containing protein [Bacteroidetes bacterium]|nr:ATP-binding cassette domain-containing protein [Bacteroidota bacterium]